MQKDELYKGSKKEALYEQLLTSLEGGNSQSNHLIIKEKFEGDEEAKARYQRETGESIREGDRVFLISFVDPPKRDPEGNILMETDKTITIT